MGQPVKRYTNLRMYIENKVGTHLPIRSARYPAEKAPIIPPGR